MVPLSSPVPPEDDDELDDDELDEAPEEPDDDPEEPELDDELDEPPEQATRRAAQTKVKKVRERMPMGYPLVQTPVKNEKLALMGVLTSHVASRFFLAKKDKKRALAAMRAFVAERSRPTEYVLFPERVAKAKDMVAALDAAGFEVKRDKKGDLVSLRWASDKLPYDTDTLRKLLGSFAAFVKKGSYLAIEEDDDPCRLTFQGTRVKRSMEGDDTSEAEETFHDAQRKREKGDLAGALVLFAEAIAAGEGNPADERWVTAAWGKRLWLLGELERWKELVALAPQAPESERDAPLNALSELHGDKPKQFQALLKVLLAAEPKNASALRFLTEDLHESGRYEDALAAVKRWEKVDSDDSVALRRSDILFDLARYREALAAIGKQKDEELRRAACHAMLGEDTKAKRCREAFLAAHSLDRQETWGPRIALHARVRLELGRLDEARVLAERAIAQRQETPAWSGPFTLGRVRLAIDQPKDAVDLLTRALEGAPRSSTTRYWLAKALARSGGDKKKIKKLCDEAKETPHVAGLVAADPDLGTKKK